MIQARALVVAGPGTNRDVDVVAALSVVGAEPSVALAAELVDDPTRLDDADMLVIAGGFSYGDSLGAGKMLALDIAGPTGDTKLGLALAHFVCTGRPVLGICNGFQVLTQAGLLPGALGHNQHGRFDCRWVSLAPQLDSVCVWLDGGADDVHCPIAHGEGRYVHPDPDGLRAAGQVALRYSGFNPNGSVADIAGVCDASGVVLGLMPHPENHLSTRQHPAHRSSDMSRHLGARLFEAGVRHANGL